MERTEASLTALQQEAASHPRGGLTAEETALGFGFAFGPRVLKEWVDEREDELGIVTIGPYLVTALTLDSLFRWVRPEGMAQSSPPAAPKPPA